MYSLSLPNCILIVQVLLKVRIFIAMKEKWPFMTCSMSATRGLFCSCITNVLSMLKSREIAGSSCLVTSLAVHWIFKLSWMFTIFQQSLWIGPPILYAMCLWIIFWSFSVVTLHVCYWLKSWKSNFSWEQCCCHKILCFFPSLQYLFIFKLSRNADVVNLHCVSCLSFQPLPNEVFICILCSSPVQSHRHIGQLGPKGENNVILTGG